MGACMQQEQPINSSESIHSHSSENDVWVVKRTECILYVFYLLAEVIDSVLMMVITTNAADDRIFEDMVRKRNMGYLYSG